MELWRISDYQTLSGDGGLRASGRWHTAGRRVVYLAESPAGALLEALVHLELWPERLPPRYTMLRVAVPDGMPLPEVALSGLNSLDDTRIAGDRWLRDGRSALLRVPSALAPRTWKALLNPAHADATRLRILETLNQPWDARLAAGAGQISSAQTPP